ncbi:imelysin family protein [Falsirhodobacter xinxiangensis]|uniref:imelysin family protein n=1 Tax=Falsirhodobacter xinxiangensis TaxID=2530049 RepID=UPI0010AA864B|nr:imelysin family protein [Rhodobacter xinxiangensis]
MKTLLALVLMAAPAFADTATVVNARIGPGYQRFAATAAELADTAADTCAREVLIPLFNDTFDAWIAVAHIRIGPVEDDGRGLAIAFWPDTRGTGKRVLDELTQGTAPLDGFERQSVAARGLFALERLLYDPAYSSARGCEVIGAAATDLQRMSGAILEEWYRFAGLMLTAGAPGNHRFLTREEATQAIYTQIMTGLAFNADMRLGRPMGSFDHPRPERAEARLSQRSLRNLRLSLAAIEADALSLKPDIPRTFQAMEKARRFADRMDDPDFADAATPEGWLKLEILQQLIHAVIEAAQNEIGGALGIGAGFNTTDGD